MDKYRLDRLGKTFRYQGDDEYYTVTDITYSDDGRNSISLSSLDQENIPQQLNDHFNDVSESNLQIIFTAQPVNDPDGRNSIKLDKSDMDNNMFGIFKSRTQSYPKTASQQVLSDPNLQGIIKEYLGGKRSKRTKRSKRNKRSKRTKRT